MIMHIIESATGDTLGHVNIMGMDDEEILQWLCDRRFLDGSPDDYEITRSYPFAEGEIVVIEAESHQPILTVQIPSDNEARAA